MAKVTCKYCLLSLTVPVSKPTHRLRTALAFTKLKRWHYIGAGKGICPDCNLLADETFPSGENPNDF